MDIVDLIKVEVKGSGVIIPKKEVKECNNACGCKIPSVDTETENDTAV